jgi:mono/diheme cytochrome c family protein
VGARRGWLRRALFCALGALTFSAAMLAGLYVASELRLSRRYPLAERALAVPMDRASLARGRHLVEAVAQCAHCHGDDLGGRIAADEVGLGRLYAPNLTAGKGGIGADYRAEDFARAIRRGVDREGRALWVMPSQYLRALSDRDLGSVIAYLRAAPEVDRAVPDRRTGWLTRLALVLGRAPDLLPAETIDHGAVQEASAPRADAAPGRYLVDIGNCRVCHRSDLSGGLHPLAVAGEPLPPNLTPGGRLAVWSETDFLGAMRTGRTPDGRRLDARFMPWPRFGRMSDGELRAIWRYLGTVPPKA